MTDHTTHHAHCVDTLRDRLIDTIAASTSAVIYLTDSDDDVAGEARCDLVDELLAVVQPELDQREAAHRRDLTRNVNSSRVQCEEIKRLRAELARIAELCGDDESNPDHAVALVRRQEHEDRTTIDRLIAERDQASRRAEAAEAERDGLRVLAGERADQRDFVYKELDKLRAERDELQQKLDLTRDMADRQEDEQDGNAVELIRQRDEAIRRAEAAEADVERWQSVCITSYEQTARVRAERDELQNELNRSRNQRDEVRKELTDQRDKQAEIATDYRDERDELQARIDNTLALAKQYRTINDDTVYALAAEVTERLSPVLPADDSSEAEPQRPSDDNHVKITWQPAIGDPVERYSGIGWTRATVTGRSGLLFTVHEPDGGNFVVELERLRPAGGEQQ